jgi:hypothetical protein
MNQRCEGRVPCAVRVERRQSPGMRRERDVPIGKCPICGAWIFVMSNGLLHPHVNQLHRRPPRQPEGKLYGSA